MKHVTITEKDDITAAKVDAKRNVALNASASPLAAWRNVTRTANKRWSIACTALPLRTAF